MQKTSFKPKWEIAGCYDLSVVSECVSMYQKLMDDSESKLETFYLK